MSETEKLLKYYKSFYHQVWGNDYISSDTTYEISKRVTDELGYSNDDIDFSEVEKELAKLTD